MLAQTARILRLAHVVMGGLDSLPPEAIQKPLESRKLLGLQKTNTLENRCGL
jgi:hypothetical protein